MLPVKFVALIVMVVVFTFVILAFTGNLSAILPKNTDLNIANIYNAFLRVFSSSGCESLTDKGRATCESRVEGGVKICKWCVYGERQEFNECIPINNPEDLNCIQN